MRIKIMTLVGLTIGAISTGLAVAEESSVAGVMADLKEVAGSASVGAPAVAVPAAVVVEPVAAEPLDVEAAIEESREYYVAADYLRARQGFESVLAKEHGNPVARYYLKKMNERQQRKAEQTAMDAVESSWNGMVFRDYSLSADAVKTMGVSEADEAVDVSPEFPEVDFPEGAYATYRPSLSRLFVQNTLANMDRMEAVMASLTAPRKGDVGQVEIETRFVEFSEGALEELGFEWSTPSSIEVAGNVELPLVDGEGQSLFADALRSVPFGKTAPLGLGEEPPTSPGWSVNRIEDMFSDEAGTLAFSGNLAGKPIDLLIRALDQTSGADVLSAPSIVTLSGKKATITVGERHSYPMEYEEGVSGGTMLHVRYEAFEEKILGVEMDVTPTISGDSIDLKINPKITELIGWEQFLLAPADSSYTYYQYRVGNEYEHDPVVAKLPIFKRRELKTEISVSSGSTVGLGGLISEKVEAFEDRVPVLGSIPLLGRLFRSEGERAVKRNLMIFVTASKVDPSGRMVATRNFE